MTHDVIIIGGSYSGLAAALQLARARRRILVIDAGQRRNRFASHSHGFLTQDGVPPGEIAEKARAQLMAYKTVDWLGAEVSAAEQTGTGFAVTANGARHAAARLILATGIVDELPPVPGLAERWGVHVFHCPYCHGYELNMGRIGVLAVSELSMHHALMLPDWGETTLFLNDSFAPDEKQRAELAARGVAIVSGPVARIAGEKADMVMAGGRIVPLDGLFTVPSPRLSPLAAALGCEIEQSPLGGFIKTDMMKATNVPGLFACGDTARPGGSVAFAVADGTLAGIATHRTLIAGLEAQG